MQSFTQTLTPAQLQTFKLSIYPYGYIVFIAIIEIIGLNMMNNIKIECVSQGLYIFL